LQLSDPEICLTLLQYIKFYEVAVYFVEVSKSDRPLPVD
jgi:hypothetical protein